MMKKFNHELHELHECLLMDRRPEYSSANYLHIRVIREIRG
jgi:hypothetical protein